MRDSYEQFFKLYDISKEKFFEFGLTETLYIPLDTAEEEWELLKYKIKNNEDVYIRGFGRDAAGTHKFFDFYRSALELSNVKKDPTNNSIPSKLISKLTRYSKKPKRDFEHIQNYQVSHIWGRTKNIYAFSAPWNIAFVPKLLDPWTGHEAGGVYVDEYQKLLQKQTLSIFKGMINDFNLIIKDDVFINRKNIYFEKLLSDNRFDPKEISKFRSIIDSEFQEIITV